MNRVLSVLIACGALVAQAAMGDEDPRVAREAEVIAKLRGIPSNLQKDRGTGLVRFVRLSKSVVANEHLELVSQFEMLRYLAVVTPAVDDEGLKHVSRLKQLEVLFLSDSAAGDDSLERIAELPKLRRLYVDRTRVSDEGLASVAKLSELTTLSLDGTSITATGLRRLAELKNLEALSLRDTGVDDDALQLLAQLPALKSLTLDGTQIGGAKLAAFVEAKSLESLSLCRTEISTDGLEALARLKHVKRIVLWQAQLPPDADDLLAAVEKPSRFHLGDRPGAWKRLLAGEPLAAAQATTGDVAKVELSKIASPIHQRLGDDPPDFQQHVVPLLGRLGCNGRTCHGSFQGRGGFRLSMFGYDFAADHEALTAGDEPRVAVDAADESLILYKPTHGDEHGGGQRLEADSWQYRLLREWIAVGAKGADAPQKLLRLEVTPREILFQRQGEEVRMRAVAVWSDGAREDVTELTRFQSNDEAVAVVDKSGVVRCAAPGETHVVSFYDKGVAATQVLLPVSDQVGKRFPKIEPATEVDRLILDKLAKLGVVPSPRCSDEEFLRRVSLDIAGTLPTAEEVRAFAADTAPDKRQRVIDKLLDSPAYAEWWTVWLSDLTGSNPQYLGSTDMNRPAASQWSQWLRRRLADNVGWDKIAAGILLATSREQGETYGAYAAQQSRYLRKKSPEDFTAPANSMHYYWFRSNNQQPADRALSFGYVFLGVRLQCAQCHKHPFDQWSQQDFEQFSQFFRRVKIGASADAAEDIRQLKTKLGVPQRLNTAALRRQMYLRVAAEGLPIPWNEVYIEPPGDMPLTAKILGGETLDLNQFADPREPLVAWLLSKDNYYFPRAVVNRIWKHYLGTGIVEPPDDFNMANPPSNAALLDYLAEEFVARGYDLKWLHRTICLSDAYQRSWRTNDTNRRDQRNFSRAKIRRLPAEVTVDAILQATSADARNSTWLTHVAGRKITQHPLSIQARSIDYSLLIFGKPLRTTNCDCERQAQPTLLQSLYIRNDKEMLGWLERSDGWLQQLAKELQQPLSAETTPAKPSKQNAKDPAGPAAVDDQKLETLVDAAYLRSVSRLPSESERLDALQHIREVENTVEGLRDLMWALLNTQEFLTNH